MGWVKAFGSFNTFWAAYEIYIYIYIPSKSSKYWLSLLYLAVYIYTCLESDLYMSYFTQSLHCSLVGELNDNH